MSHVEAHHSVGQMVLHWGDLETAERIKGHLVRRPSKVMLCSTFGSSDSMRCAVSWVGLDKPRHMSRKYVYFEHFLTYMILYMCILVVCFSFDA